jgi:hypothetical protein
MIEKLKKIIEETVSKVISEDDDFSAGLTDANGKPIVTGRLVRPVDKSDKRWGKINGVTIDLKIRVQWLDPESKYSGKKKETAENPKNMEIY